MNSINLMEYLYSKLIIETNESRNQWQVDILMAYDAG
jgi:hypothetical protein